jgi:RNA polymerase sigma-70 factor (sigma-E family)
MGAPRRTAEFDALFDRVWAPSVRLAGRLVGAADAEDVAVEALARALARWERVHDLAHVDAWVMRVAANVALDRLRHRRRHPVLVPEPVPTPQDTTALRLTLQEALRRLPRRQSEVVTLRYLAELSEPEVAAALGLSLGTVKTHTRRGVAALRRRFGEHPEELFDGA